MNLRVFILFIVTFFGLNLAGQTHSILPDSFYKSENYGSLKNWIKAGVPILQSRLFYMSTRYNNSLLKDDYSLAAGAGLGYVSAPYKGFGFGVNGFAIAEVVSSPLHKPDTATGQQNRYELGLYDITKPTQRYLLRPEELFVYWDMYNLHKFKLLVGRFLINTPFINPQDGRMRGTLVQGIWQEAKWGKYFATKLGMLGKVMPRSTTQWYNVSSSIGLYPSGFSGMYSPLHKSNYFGNVHSAAIYIGEVGYKRKNLDIELWNYFIDPIFNTVFLQIEYRIKNWKWGLQTTRQDVLGNGGNVNPTKAYFDQKNNMVFSGRIEYKFKNMVCNLNATRVLGNGRFLFPREWGREPFYTFMPRERMEGTGNSMALTAGMQSKLANGNVKFSLVAGYFQNQSLGVFPNQKESIWNKYSQPSYFQINVAGTYAFKKAWKGLEISSLLVYKGHANKGSLLPKFEYNRVNLFQLNFVVNYLLPYK